MRAKWRLGGRGEKGHGCPRRARSVGMARAPTARMHALLFGLKRAWHGSLRTTRRALAAVGLTAARFDLLYAVQARDPRLAVTQREIRKTLGVNRTTVSRMLGSLEALGLVTRERAAYGDRRTRTVRLTEQGRRRIRVAIGRLIGSGAAQLAVDSAVVGPPWGVWYDASACLDASEVLESFLQRIRHAFGDFATLLYRWHPDD
jgi:DNA-binding MarR family transcriptional regulator